MIANNSQSTHGQHSFELDSLSRRDWWRCRTQREIFVETKENQFVAMLSSKRGQRGNFNLLELSPFSVNFSLSFSLSPMSSIYLSVFL